MRVGAFMGCSGITISLGGTKYSERLRFRAIRSYCEVSNEWFITQIYFHISRHYWIPLCYRREWFKRIKDG
jgi:hypothetical protein